MQASLALCASDLRARLAHLQRRNAAAASNGAYARLVATPLRPAAAKSTPTPESEVKELEEGEVASDADPASDGELSASQDFTDTAAAVADVPANRRRRKRGGKKHRKGAGRDAANASADALAADPGTVGAQALGAGPGWTANDAAHASTNTATAMSTDGNSGVGRSARRDGTPLAMRGAGSAFGSPAPSLVRSNDGSTMHDGSAAPHLAAGALPGTQEAAEAAVGAVEQQANAGALQSVEIRRDASPVRKRLKPTQPAGDLASAEPGGDQQLQDAEANGVIGSGVAAAVVASGIAQPVPASNALPMATQRSQGAATDGTAELRHEQDASEAPVAAAGATGFAPSEQVPAGGGAGAAGGAQDIPGLAVVAEAVASTPAAAARALATATEVIDLSSGGGATPLTSPRAKGGNAAAAEGAAGSAGAAAGSVAAPIDATAAPPAQRSSSGQAAAQQSAADVAGHRPGAERSVSPVDMTNIVATVGKGPGWGTHASTAAMPADLLVAMQAATHNDAAGPPVATGTEEASVESTGAVSTLARAVISARASGVRLPLLDASSHGNNGDDNAAGLHSSGPPVFTPPDELAPVAARSATKGLLHFEVYEFAVRSAPRLRDLAALREILIAARFPPRSPALSRADMPSGFGRGDHLAIPRCILDMSYHTEAH